MNQHSQPNQVIKIAKKENFNFFNECLFLIFTIQKELGMVSSCMWLTASRETAPPMAKEIYSS